MPRTVAGSVRAVGLGPARLVALWLAVMGLNLGGLAGLAVVDESSSAARAQRTQLRWVLAAIESPPSDAEIISRFHGSFRREFPPDEIRRVLVGLRTHAPYRIVRTSRVDGELVAIVQGQDMTWRITIDVEPGGTHRIWRLLVVPHGGGHAPARSWAEVDGALRRTAAEVGLLAAEIVDGECLTVHEMAADEPLALASVFKLYVLGAVADAVAAGRASWDQKVEIRDDQLTQGSETYGTVRPGTKADVRTLARAMIDVSDNTATDVLMELVGRDAVQRATVTMGMADPSRNAPFLLTRELSLLKFGRPPLAAEYLALPDEAARRRFLDARLAGRRARLGDLTLSPRPAHVDTIEWFATPNDLCRAHVALQDMARRPGLEPIRDIVEVRTPAFSPRPDYLAAKGGGEPGVATGAWYFERGDDRHVLVVLLRNRDKQFALNPGYLLDAYRLLAAAK